MKVLFIYPKACGRTGFCYAVASLSAVLKEAGHETALISVNTKASPAAGDDELLVRVNKEKPGLIGFSVEAGLFTHAAAVAGKIRRAFAHIPIAIGGTHATDDPQGVLETGLFDYACVGEGEEALLELVEAIKTGDDATGIANIWARRDGAIISNEPRAPKARSKTPPIDYEIFDFQRVIDENDGRVSLWVGGRAKSRPENSGHRGADEVVGEVRRLTARYGNIRRFVFEDNLCADDKAYVREFSLKYREATDVPFACGADAKFFDEETARLLAGGGCVAVEFAMASGSERLRKEALGGSVSSEAIEKAFGAAGAAGLATSAAVMMGLSGESEKDLGDTAEFLARMSPGRFRWALSAKAGTGESADLKREKMRVACPWYVNAYSEDGLVSRLYSRLVRVIESLDAEAFGEFGREVARLDDLLHQVLARAGHEHYHLSHDDCTAVRSTWKE